jgi:membrane protease YdiL (CAAX protease family)
MTPQTNSQPSATSNSDAWSRSKLQSWFDGRFPGSAGLKSLLCVLAYIAGGVLILFVLWTVAGYLLPPDAPRLWGRLLAEGILAVAAIAPALVVARWEDRSFGAYGLGARSAFGKRFWTGAAWGLLSLTTLLIILRIAGAISFEGIAMHGARIVKFGLFWALYFLLVAFYEEFAFRGYLFFACSQAIGFWPAALVSSLLFGLVHRMNPGENWVGAVGAAAMGLFFSLTLRRTGNLWFAVGMHAAWDWSETFLYNVPDSGFIAPGHLLRTSLDGSSWLTGGSVGPEASVLLFVLVAVLSILFNRLYPEAKYGVRNSSQLSTSIP